MSPAAAARPPDRAMVATFLPVVRRIARRMHARLPPGVDLDDLVGAGLLGLLEAAARFEPSRGVPFASYARHRIQGAMVDALRAVDWVPLSVRRRAAVVLRARTAWVERHGRLPTLEELVHQTALSAEVVSQLLGTERPALLSLDAEGPDQEPMRDRIPAPQDASQAALYQEIWEAVSRLPARERLVVTAHFLDERTLRDIGVELGVTESRVCQICRLALEHLRAHFTRQEGGLRAG